MPTLSEKLVARSATPEAACPESRQPALAGLRDRSERGKPLRVSPQPSSLDGTWIEIFRAGDYADRGRWTERDLDHIAATYNPRLHAAPVVLGHPADDAPAFAWVKALRRAGSGLWAQLEKVDPAFEQLLRAGRFRTRSVALYTHFPPTRGPYLRHVGFLGAHIPAVKALAPVHFAEGEHVRVQFQSDQLASRHSLNPEDVMSDSKSKLDAFFDHLRRFFTPESAEDSSGHGSCPEPALLALSQAEGSDLEGRIAQLEQRLDELAADLSAEAQRAKAEKRTAEAKLSEQEATRGRQQIETFIETLRARGKFPPVFERLGVRTFLERLAELDGARDKSFASFASEAHEAKEATETEENPPESLVTWFQEFLTRLPALINFNELTPDTGPGSRATNHDKLVRFAEPQRGVAVDPASVELAEQAAALAAELGISYAEALGRLRAEHRAAHATP